MPLASIIILFGVLVDLRLHFHNHLVNVSEQAKARSSLNILEDELAHRFDLFFPF